MLARSCKSLILFVLVLFGSFPQSAKANDCDQGFHRILKSTLYSEQKAARSVHAPKTILHSAWGKNEYVRHLNEEYKDFTFKDSWKSLVPIGKGSLGEVLPELGFILDDIAHYQLDLEHFSHEFTQLHGRHPYASEYREFYETRTLIFKDGVRSWCKALKQLNPAAAETLEHSLEYKISMIRESIPDIVIALGTAPTKKAIKATQSQMYGILGELYGTTAIPKLKSSSILLSEIGDISIRIDRKIEMLKRQIRAHPSLLGALERKYPHIFHAPAPFPRDPELWKSLPREERRLESIRDWMGSKEIDFVRDQNGTRVFVELKSRKAPLDYEEFIKEKGGKSSAQQILETREILEFLGYQTEITLEYYATAGVTPEVRKSLQSQGVRILEFETR